MPRPSNLYLVLLQTKGLPTRTLACRTDATVPLMLQQFLRSIMPFMNPSDFAVSCGANDATTEYIGLCGAADTVGDIAPTFYFMLHIHLERARAGLSTAT